MEEERVEAVKTWPEPQSVRDIQVFLSFANFYRKFIKNFSRIAALLTSMLRIKPSSSSPTSGSKETVNLTGIGVRSGGVRGVDSAGGAGGAGSVGEKAKNLEKSAKSKKPNFTETKNSNRASGKDFLTLEARLAFT